ncbi:M28 family peptidase [Dokdonia sp. PRO95]|uniref:M28 family peptidase n=1 Tax=Dokdonia sp. PRO95 TaxID=1239415 RepID=UPI00055547DC|nr:M28 family peptidase [Dokdonia sp. PRO95]
MKNILVLVGALVLVGCGSPSPLVGVKGENVSTAPASQVTMVMPDIKKMKSVKSTMEFLASDELQGRDTGSKGIEMAAQFIEARFKDAGIKPYFENYRDPFDANGVEAFNIVGVLEGNDPKLKDEVIIIGAHYDHIGTAKAVGDDTIANGANDNAAGTTTVLALTDHFTKAKSNKRTIIFTLYSAEEKGLLGSKDLSSRLKAAGIDLYTMISIEMVGVPMVDKDHSLYASGYEKSNFAEKFNQYAGEKVIGFLPKAKEFNLFKRSDNYPFFLDFNIPAHTISSFDFTNYDHYHGVGDEADKMDIDFMEGLIKKLIPGITGMANSPNKEIKMN